MELAHGERIEGVQAIPTHDVEEGGSIVTAKFKVVKKNELVQKGKVRPHIFVIVTSFIGLNHLPTMLHFALILSVHNFLHFLESIRND